MTLQRLTQELAVVTVVADAAKARKDELRGEILDALRAVGADSAKSALPDGTQVGKASAVTRKRTAVVESEDELARYVEQDSPTEVVLRVRESYRRVLLDRLVEGPDGEAVDPDTGVIVPGVRFGAGSEYVSMRFTKTGREDVMEAIRNRAVALDGTTIGEIEK